MKYRLITTLSLATTLALANGRAHATLLDLGTLGGTTSQAFGIRSDGSVVVGSSLNATNQTQAFSYSSGTMTALSFLSGGTAAEAHAVVGTTVVGYSKDSGGIEQAVSWTGTAPTLISNTLGGSGARALGESSGGVVVGWAKNAAGVQRAYVYSGGTMSALDLSVVDSQHDPSFGHNARALGISPNGRYVVGEFDVDTGAGSTEVRGFVYDRTTPANSYEFSGGGVGSARATNDTNAVGVIVNPPDPLAGFSQHSSGTANFLVPLAGGSGSAEAINAAGFSVGTTNIAGVGQRATAWGATDTTTTPIDLNTQHNTAGATLVSATGVADTGNAISGWGTFGGQTHAYLITIPEPATLALLALSGLVGLPLLRRRQLL